MNDVNTEADRLFDAWNTKDKDAQDRKDRQNPGLVMNNSPENQSNGVIWAVYGVIAAHLVVILWRY